MKLDLLARKVSRAKWERKDYLADGEIAADAVTADLRTTNNKLSLWKCIPGGTGLDAVFLALAAGMDYPATVDVALVSGDALQQDNIQLQPTPGDTPVADLQDRHLDAIQLDLTRLGKIAQRLAETAEFHRKTQRTVMGLIVEAVQADRMKLSDLKDKVRDEVEKYLQENPSR